MINKEVALVYIFFIYIYRMIAFNRSPKDIIKPNHVIGRVRSVITHRRLVYYRLLLFLKVGSSMISSTLLEYNHCMI